MNWDGLLFSSMGIFGNRRQLDLVCGRISKFLDFSKISALSQRLALVQNQLEKLGEVYTINFFK